MREVCEIVVFLRTRRTATSAHEVRHPIRVVDLGRMNPFQRAVRLGLLGGRSLPVVTTRGSCAWHTLREREAPTRSEAVRAGSWTDDSTGMR